ncbi:hypothetical protein LTR36_002382 [Oleoguttula mirabilis]|uniref:Amidase domain-containing protein n=1 Tax=Oleoguttula mirabilis TaxID=1507867 RepID=A0AAV9JKJ5_9PEZI|nr:hypothetical protein LTR36_002382 [Oleoguttula mirabilis]
MAETNGEPAWLTKALRKRKIQAAALQPYLAQEAGPADETITAIACVETLAGRVADGDFTAYDVVSAYVRKAAAAHQKTNCLTEIMFDDALQRARELDEHYVKHKTPIGPLHGVVMTLKDQFNVKGYDTTLGYVGRTFQPADTDAVVVTLLKDMGVIFIAKTNLPQSIMWCETDNPLWGLTTNPLNPAFTPGGSTGGEGALLAQHGSMVGWGTDIGGSVRIPSHMAGLYALKPSSGRIPYLGTPVSTEGQEHVPSAVGPMTRSLSSLRLVTKAVIDAAPWKLDPQVHPLPWREEAYREVQSRPLVIGLLIDDGIVKVHPPIERVLRDVAAKLQKAGHEVIQWDGSLHFDCIQTMDSYYSADGGEDIRRDMSVDGEPYIPHVAALVDRGPAISVYEYWQLHRAKRAAQKAYLDKWQRLRSEKSGREADVLLTPTMPHSAVPHRSCRWVGYTKVWNLLDYTACVLPVGSVDKTVDLAASEPSVEGYVARNETDKWNWALYNPETLHGMPLSVQLVGRRLEEEKVLGAAEVVERVLSEC